MELQTKEEMDLQIKDSTSKPTPECKPQLTDITSFSDEGDAEVHHNQSKTSNEQSSPKSHKLTPLSIVQHTISITLLLLSLYTTHTLIIHNCTKLSSTHPSVAIITLWACITWLGMMEGQQASLVGLRNGVVDHAVYRESHANSWRGVVFVGRGDNLDRYVTGRQFLVLLCVFTINLSGSPSTTDLPLPNSFLAIFSSTGLAMILITAMISQLPPQINASVCMIDFINGYFALGTMYVAVGVEFSGIMHASYLVRYVVEIVSGKSQSRQEERSVVQSIFFWARVCISLVILGFSMAVTVAALFQGKTTIWDGVPKAVSIILFFVLLIVAGLLEAMQIAFLATSKMRKEHRGTSYFGKKSIEVSCNKLPAFFVGRQLMVVGCFFLLARITTPNVTVGQGENIFGVSDGVQTFLNSGLHAALLLTILGSTTWKLAASAFPVAFVNMPSTYFLLWIGLIIERTGVCSCAFLLARLMKYVTKLQLDEVYVGTPENPILSQDTLDAMRTEDVLDIRIMPSRSFDALDGPCLVEGSKVDANTPKDVEEGSS